MRIINKHVPINVYGVHKLTFKITTKIKITNFLKVKNEMHQLKNKRTKIIN